MRLSLDGTSQVGIHPGKCPIPLLCLDCWLWWLATQSVVGTALGSFHWCCLQHDSPGGYAGTATVAWQEDIWFHGLTLPKQTCCLAAPESSLLWGRMHYIQFVSNRYFSNLFLEHLGGGDSHLVSCPSLHCAHSWKAIVTLNSPLQIKPNTLCVSAVANEGN